METVLRRDDTWTGLLLNDPREEKKGDEILICLVKVSEQKLSLCRRIFRFFRDFE